VAGTGERVPLSRERVLHAAIELADADGIASLTMRRLGQALGVEAMSLYNHVANKDDILNGIVEIVMGEIALPAGEDWKAALRASALSAHEALWRHPWACSLMMSPANSSPARLRWMDAVLGCLREAGFSAALTHHAYHALDSHITGFTLWVVNLPAVGEELKDIAATFLKEHDFDEYPYLVEHIHYHLAPPDDESSEFEFGLDLILDGLERLRDQSRWAGPRITDTHST
jgi:AcrR family transcriptional regulator